ncbi:carbon storage regulator CsrA [Paenibacillus rigui]|uniref:Translational regulator CsrA n=1 Tax=Paenibacillus rigui TaxID=554312 RepID=A0A229USX4_9BACL|nr:carbon storage regulator CsrA [Paenibacillus rigui]OXM86361.1 carbon storage regulator [Paenibacillus rigui]
MLILTRKKGQSIIINNDIEIVISSIDGDQVKVGISAPAEVNVLRKEVFVSIQESNREAAKSGLGLEGIKKLVKPE